jgi:hypothetical protein
MMRVLAFAVALSTLMLSGCDTTLREQIELYVSIKNGGVIYVDGTDGDDANPGTQVLPKKSIQNAIDLAAALMDDGEVHVAEGLYELYETLIVREGISIHGGYGLPSWAPPLDPGALPTTTIQGNGIATVMKPDRGVTSATVIQGFTIVAASEDTVTCIWCDHSSPTIRYNYIDASQGSSHSSGIYNKYASPIIDANTINAGSGSVLAFGIWNFHSSPKIWNNVIYGEDDFRGVYNETGCDAVIQNNTIRVGTVAIDGIGLYNTDSTCIVENNIFFSTNATSGWAIYESADTPLVDELNNNDFHDCAECYSYGNPVTSFNFTGMITYLTGKVDPVSDNTDVDPQLFDQSGSPWEWYLSGTNVSQAGKSLSTSFMNDRKGNHRTSPNWSIGAYEKD